MFQEPQLESIHSLSFGSSALNKYGELSRCDDSQGSISSIEYFSDDLDNHELESYLENRSDNSLHIYAKSKDRRSCDTLSGKDRHTSEASSVSAQYSYSDEIPRGVQEETDKNIRNQKENDYAKNSSFSVLEEEILPFLSPSSDSETDESSSISALEVKNNKKMKDLKLCFQDDKNDMEEKQKIVANLADMLDIPRYKLKEEEKPIEDDKQVSDVPEISRNKWRTVVINVGGVDYRSKISNFSKYPASRLGKIFRAKTKEEILLYCDGYKPGNPPVIYFDRNDQNFSAIIDCYRMEELHICGQNCALVIQEDLAFWGIDELFLEPCCSLKYYPHIVGCQNELEEEKNKIEADDERQKDENFGDNCTGKIRSMLWNFLEYPETSKSAQALAFMSLFMVCLSTVTFVVGTNFEGEEETVKKTLLENSTIDIYNYEEITIRDVIETIDNIAVMFFTVEYVLRLVMCPKKDKFLMSRMNLIDLLAIAPFFLSVVLAGLEDMQVIGKAGKIIRLVRIMRIMRIFKMVRHFAGLQSLVYTLQQAYKELGLLFLLVAVAILLFTSLIFAVESEGPDAEFWSFYDSFWWGLMTLTTVGYNMTPVTFFGKFICGMCAVTGIFILTLPIPIVVTSFASCYKNRLWRNEIAMKKRIISAQTKENKLTEKRNLFADLAGKGGFYINQYKPDTEYDSNTSMVSLTPSPNDFTNRDTFDFEMAENEPFIHDNSNSSIENKENSTLDNIKDDAMNSTISVPLTSLESNVSKEAMNCHLHHTDL